MKACLAVASILAIASAQDGPPGNCAAWGLISGLERAMVDKIEISFGYEGFELKVTLTETKPDECDASELVSEQIELEGEYEMDLEDLFAATEGSVEFSEEIV